MALEGSAEGLRLHPHTAFIDLLLLCGIYCGICAVASLPFFLPSLSPFLLLFFECCPNRSKFRQVAVSMVVALACQIHAWPVTPWGTEEEVEAKEGGARGHKPLKLVRLFQLGPCFGFCWL